MSAILSGDNIGNAILIAIKRGMILVVTSGLITNAIYIYGIGFYQGYISRLGFDYTLFSIEWSDAILWTYKASQDVGLESINLLNLFGVKIYVIGGVLSYIIIRVWIALSPLEKNKKQVDKYEMKRWLVRIRNRWPRVFSIIKFIAIKESALFAFFASYFFIFFMCLLVLFVIVWVYFPYFGSLHGERVAEQREKYFERHLCVSKNDYWSQCVSVDDKENNAVVYGRLLFKKEKLLGIMTTNGPVTITQPENISFNTLKNSCYMNQECMDKITD